MRNRDTHLLALGLLAAAAVLFTRFPGLLHAAPFGCGWRALTGWNCSFCGLTRDWVAIASGSWPALNPLSLPLAAAAFVLYPLCVLYCLAARCDLRVDGRRMGQSAPYLLLIMLVLNNWRRLV